MSKLILFCFLLISILPFSFAESAPPSPNAPVVNQQPTSAAVIASESNGTAERIPSPKTGKSYQVGWLSSMEFWMSLTVLTFGMLVFAIEIVMVRLTAFQPEQTIKLLVVTLIVISTLFIITAGFDSYQIAPAMGLFGTIAGYMIGRASGKTGEAQE